MMRLRLSGLSSHSSGRDSNTSLATTSTTRSSAASLRDLVLLRRESLTCQELLFLNSLVDSGSEVETSLATLKLSDDRLFCTMSNETDDTEDDENADDSGNANAADVDGRRQGALENRRRSQLHGQIWKAHQNGLALSRQSSRRSVLQREQSGRRMSLLAGAENNNAKNHVQNARTAAAAANSGGGGGGGGTRNSAAHRNSSMISQSRIMIGSPFCSPYGSIGSIGELSDSEDESDDDHDNTNHHEDNDKKEKEKAAAAAVVAAAIEAAATAVVAAAAATKQRNNNDTNKKEKKNRSSSPPRLMVVGRNNNNNNSGAGLLPPISASSLAARRRHKSLTTTNSNRRVSSVVGKFSLGEIPEDEDDDVEGDKEISPTAATAAATAPVVWEGTNFVNEEKKMSEDELQQQQKQVEEELSEQQTWQNNVVLRRASSNMYSGEGVEVAALWEENEVGMSESETYEDVEGDEDDYEDSHDPDDFKKAIIMRRASKNIYNGEGMEISDWDTQEVLEERREHLGAYYEHRHNNISSTTNSFLRQEQELLELQLQLQAAASTSAAAAITTKEATMTSMMPLNMMATTSEILPRCDSFDETLNRDRCASISDLMGGQAPPAMIHRSLSEDELSSLLTVRRVERTALQRKISETTTATMNSEDDNDDNDDESHHSFEYDAWLDAPNHAGDILDVIPFRILGTSAEDVDCHPHVLSPPLMESLQSFFPFAKTSDNFWLKYSLVRDGASMHTLLQHARGAQFSILALETVDGEVMGSFTTEPWRKTWSYFGGSDSFLWKLRHSRQTRCRSIIDQANLESEIEVYPYTGENHCIQFCTSTKIAIGGGSPAETSGECTSPSSTRSLGVPAPPSKCSISSTRSLPCSNDSIRDHEWGYGISLQKNLMHGSSSPCVTFGSPSLSETHSDGSLFEIINMELWTLTPCYSEADAQKLELGRLFLEDH